ncbi:MAG: hypothetical protein ACKV2T_13590 [Kofleriaceae bacterium]
MKSWLRRHGWWCAIAAAYLYLFPYFPEIRSANELPRVYLVQAMADHGTFAIDRYLDPRRPLVDVSPANGRKYSNKAPGSSMIVVPFYWLVSAIAGPPSFDLAMWLCRVVSGVIPAILFLALLARFLARFSLDPNVRRLVLVAYAFGTMALPYSQLYIAHQLSAVCVGAAWILALEACSGERGSRAFFAAGLLAGCAPLVDYQAAFALVPLGIHILVALRRGALRRFPNTGMPRPIVLLALGAAIPIAILLAYHAICFGSPLRTGYDASKTFAVYHQQGFLGITKLRSAAFWGTTIGPHFGLFTLSPWLLLAFPGFVTLWRRGMKDVAIACATVLVVYILFITSINFWRGGWSVGPRYITVALPFLLPPIVAQLDAWRARVLPMSIAVALMLVGVAIFTLATATFPYWPEAFENPFHELTLRLVADGLVAPNAGTWIGVPALVSLVPLALIVGALLGPALRAIGGWRIFVIAAPLAFGILVAYRWLPSTKNPDEPYRKILPAIRAAQH